MSGKSPQVPERNRSVDAEGQSNAGRIAAGGVWQSVPGDATHFLAALVESSDDAIIGKTLDGIITTWNPAAERIYGYKAEEAIGQSILLIVPPGQSEEIDDIMARLAAGQRIEHLETTRVTKDGRRVSVSLTVSPVRDSENTIVGASTIARDISTRISALENAREELERRVRERTAELADLNKDLQQHIKRRETAEEGLRFLSEASLLLAQSLDYETTLSRVANLVVPRLADWCVLDLLNAEGNIDCVTIVHSDPAKAEFTRDLRERYPADMEGDTGVAKVVRTVKPEIYPEVTDELLVRVARDEEHLRILRGLGFQSAVITPLMARGRSIGALTLIAAEGNRRYSKSDLPLVEDLAQSCALAVDNARLFAEAQREIADRERAERALRDSERRFRQLADAMPQLVWTAGEEDSLTFVNQQWQRYTGLSLEESRVRETARTIFHPDDVDGVYGRLNKAFEAGAVFESESRIKRAIDGAYRWFLMRSVPVRNGQGQVIAWFGTATDIHDQKLAEVKLIELNETLEQRVEERTAELEQTNARLKGEIAERVRAEKALQRSNTALTQSNRELQDFAYVASHDLQEPLRKIGSFVDLLRSEYQDVLDEQGLHYLSRMQAAAIRMTDLIRDLLVFSRVKTRGQPFEKIDLNAILADAVSDLEVSISEAGGKIEADRLPEIDADPTQMRQLFQNLISNAVKFHREGVPPVVQISASIEQLDVEGGVDRLRVCRIEVSDNGIGFDEQYLDRIFAPFQRLHGRLNYPGTGIGLAICRRIVERHHGTITAHSRPDEGSTFIITLPIHPAEAERDAGDEVV